MAANLRIGRHVCEVIRNHQKEVVNMLLCKIKEVSYFFKEFTKKPSSVGALIPSSNALSCNIIKGINFKKCKCIIEYGAGTGKFTEKIIENLNDRTIFLVFEPNETFFNILKEKYSKNKNVIFIRNSAENVESYMKSYGIKYADYIVSGLPFTSLPKELSQSILNNTKNILKHKGKFITFQYTLVKKDLIKFYFKNIDYKRVYYNLPPAYIFNCYN